MRRDTDILVVGAGAAGWPAAIGAARQGARVLLVDDDPYPGGAAVDQYVSMPDGGPRSGVVAEYLQQLESRFALTDRPVDKWWYFWYLPGDILRVVQEVLAAEDNVTFLGSTPIQRLTVEGSRVTGAIVRDAAGREQRFAAKIVIDATGSGGLAAAAGCDARYGEDARDDFNEAPAPSERTAAAQQCTWMFISQRLPQGDGNWVPRGLESGWGSPGRHDDAGALERQAGVYLHWGCRVDCDDTRDPAALAAAQQQSLEQMAPMLEELRGHGYLVHLAPRLGVREQWRIMGEYVVTANALFDGVIPDDSVLITQRPIDIWTAGRSQMDYPETKPYGIPYRALVPRHLDNLLVVGKHMSGTHLAMASYRVQCLLGQLGQVAGVAAALCAAGGVAPRQLAFDDLRPELSTPAQGLVIDRKQTIPPIPGDGR